MLSNILIGLYALGCVLSLLVLLARIDFKGSEIDEVFNECTDFFESFVLGTMVFVFGALMILSSWLGFGYLCFVWRKERMSDE